MSESTHFIGIGGSGISAIARVLLERGESITGSDMEMSPLALELQQDGATVFVGHSADNVNGATRVIRSSAIPDENVEIMNALQNGIPVLKRSEALREILQDQKVIAIAGSHGKTTSTAMLAWILLQLKQAPGYIVGGSLTNTGNNAAAGDGKLFVIEADEYDYMFLGLSPSIVVITNVEHDHPDIFATEQVLFEAFQKFVNRIEKNGQLIYCLDDPGASQIGEVARSQGYSTLSYSLSETIADFQAVEIEARNGSGYTFNFSAPGEEEIPVELLIPGRHNVENAVAVLAAIHLLDLPLGAAAEALGTFLGTSRRFEKAGTAQDILFYDDYAHHPTEIKASLSAARDFYPNKRIIALWQPHTFSRTVLLWDEFTSSFSVADSVVVAPVFASREEMPADHDLEMDLRNIDGNKFSYVASLASAVDHLATSLQAGDLLIVLSAGDALIVNQDLLERFGERS